MPFFSPLPVSKEEISAEALMLQIRVAARHVRRNPITSACCGRAAVSERSNPGADLEVTEQRMTRHFVWEAAPGTSI